MRERRAREETAEQVAALRASHQMELQKVLAEHAMNHSTSKVAELTGKLDTQQVLHVYHIYSSISHTFLYLKISPKMAVGLILESKWNDLLKSLPILMKTCCHFCLLLCRTNILSQNNRFN